jgi:hypothetical protein
MRKQQNRILIEPFGPDIRLPDLREEIAHDVCLAHYVDLIPKR